MAGAYVLVTPFSLAFPVFLPVCLVAEASLGASTVDSNIQGERGKHADSATDPLQNQRLPGLLQRSLDGDSDVRQDPLSADGVFLTLLERKLAAGELQ